MFKAIHFTMGQYITRCQYCKHDNTVIIIEYVFEKSSLDTESFQFFAKQILE
jgi:hypothetical protein